jgi:AraC-like DNA-binding protein
MISPVVNKAIRQIISCPYRSSLKRLFLEGKVLELISYSLAQFESSADALQKDALLPSDDIERVLEARNILIRNLEDPPSLQTLARKVGTNKTTLSKGFRQLFGTSAFEYLRTRRLERARELLESKEMNVTEAAYSVGYAQHSSFTKAFKKHFGTNPTDHLP